MRLAAIALWCLAACVVYVVALWLPVLFPALFGALLVSAEYLAEERCHG